MSRHVIPQKLLYPPWGFCQARLLQPGTTQIGPANAGKGGGGVYDAGASEVVLLFRNSDPNIDFFFGVESVDEEEPP